MWRFYVYQHRRSDDGAVFYIGKGAVRARCRKQVCERAYATTSRNTHWRRVVAKHGLTVEILASFRTDVDAQEFEKALIARYGRASLVNLTDGGDGHAGIVTSAELRAIRSKNSRGPRSPTWVASIRRSRKNGGNGGVVKRGDKLPESWRSAIAAGQRGPNNYMRGRVGALHPKARAVIDTRDGSTFPTVTAAAEANGIGMQTLHGMLTGNRPNRTALRFA